MMKSGRQGPADLAGRDNSGRFFTRRGVKKRRDVSKVGRIAEGGKVARSHSSSSVKTTKTARGEGEKEEDHFVIRLTSD